MKRHKIFADLNTVDPAAMNQFYNAMRLDHVVAGAIMPDVHKGYALPIGSVVATEGVIIPAWVGYDIGCGVCAIKTSFDKQSVIDASDLIFDGIYAAIPVGFNHNTVATSWDDSAIPRTAKLAEIMNYNGYNQLGSLGGGNHFIEIGYDETDAVWIVIHSGSRGVGHKCATHHMNIACTGQNKEWHYPLDVNSDAGKDYITDLNYCLEFALKNREEMINRVISVINHLAVTGKAIKGTLINRNHNHADYKDGMWIHRKGATHAESGMMGVIPGNMRDGSFIVEGKGNPDSLWSSSHGAGRVMGRADAKRTLDMDEFTETMANVTARVQSSTLDESPMAYKDIFKVMEEQSDLVTIKHHILPLINIKA